jgi:hypothetical protein
MRISGMNRLAIFVEGYTEVVFIKKLIEEIAGRHRVLIEHRKILGGATTRRRYQLIRAAQPLTDQEYFFLIIDCGGDDQVKTRIIEEHQNLTNNGYTKIIGVRDVRPKFTYADIPKLEINLPRYISTSLIPVKFILSIMEIEAWFLAETTHFQKIDPSITVEAINTSLGFNPETENMEQRATPAEDLSNCYAIGGKRYLKHDAKRTVDALDYALIYLELNKKFRYLNQLITCIDAFLT